MRDAFRMRFIKVLFRFALWSIFLIMVAISFVVIYFAWSGEPSKPSASNLKVTAISYCKVQVKQSLKDPSSVDWTDWQSWPVSVERPIWTVLAKYRAKNSFGAVVPGEAICEVVINDEGKVVGVNLLN